MTCECRGDSSFGGKCGKHGSNYNWCYLKGGLDAKVCENKVGAILSTDKDKYWSKEVCPRKFLTFVLEKKMTEEEPSKEPQFLT